MEKITPAGKKQEEIPLKYFDFLIKDYELKVGYLNNQFSRMWTRFNFFLTAETSLLSVLNTTEGQRSGTVWLPDTSWFVKVISYMLEFLVKRQTSIILR
jgi:hypothetical protein